MTATARPTELASAMPSAPGVATITADPARLLDVANGVEEQANALQEKLRLRLGELHMARRRPTPSVCTASKPGTHWSPTEISRMPTACVLTCSACGTWSSNFAPPPRSTHSAKKSEDKATHFGDRGAHKP
jgi:hypothetical protein